MKISLAPIVLLILFFGENLHASWSIELFSGFVHNYPSPLTIRQSGYEDIHLKANYHTKSFQFPLYYVVRTSRWHRERAWELEFIHHKLFLTNRPLEVQRFAITHGLNLLMVNRAWKFRLVIFRMGIGVIFAHPETTVREKRYSERKGILKKGYHLSDSVVQVALGKKFDFFSRLMVSIEAKITHSFSLIPIKDGKADVENVAFHGLLGLGFRF